MGAGIVTKHKTWHWLWAQAAGGGDWKTSVKNLRKAGKDGTPC